MFYKISFYILAFVILLFVIAYFYFKKRKSKPETTETIKLNKKDIINETIDYQNLFKSTFNSKQLYDELKVKCHPDRFPDNENLNSIANEIFQEISKNKTNLKKLEELKLEAIEKLNINFKNP